MKFSVFTHVNHLKSGGEYFAYSPYIREMNIWLKHVDEVEIVAPCSKPLVRGPVSGIFYKHPNLLFSVIPSINFSSINSSIQSILKLPSIFLRIYQAMRKADHIHLRCPGNIGLLACFVQILFPAVPKTAKYAGNWDPNAEQPWSYKLQRWILSNSFLSRNMQVLVYGEWPNQTQNVLPFFTASFSEDLKETIIKDLKPPHKFVFAGALVKGKQPLCAVKIIEELIKNQIPVVLEIYGNGLLYKELEEYIQLYNLEPFVTLHGNQKQEVLINAFKTAHFTILPSLSEGWPKAIAEGMFFGCVPIATAVSCIPLMLKAPPAPEGGAKKFTLTERGILIPDPNRWELNSQFILEDTVERIFELINRPEEMKWISLEAQEWSQQYTLEKFEEAIKEVLAPQPPKGEHKTNIG